MLRCTLVVIYKSHEVVINTIIRKYSTNIKPSEVGNVNRTTATQITPEIYYSIIVFFYFTYLVSAVTDWYYFSNTLAVKFSVIFVISHLL